MTPDIHVSGTDLERFYIGEKLFLLLKRAKLFVAL
jgi:hypothetical protein